MYFNKLAKDSNEGLKRKISSRREKIFISVEMFETLSKKYFNNVSQNSKLTIKYEEEDKDNLIFILRYHYQYWIEINKDLIQIFSSFPKEFEIIKQVNKSNHLHTPKTFKKGEKLYFNSNGYSSCNWLKGIPLWNNKNKELNKGLIPSCQINYDYIRVTS